MVVTSRGGVGCCWVNSLVSLIDYNSSSLALPLLAEAGT
jgi:hypothetical protein